MSDRDKVKDLLQNLLPKFKKVVNKDMEEKKRVMEENPQLARLYMELVGSHVITAEEFWANHASPYLKKQAEDRNNQQSVGVSASFLADVKPETDGCNGGVRYNVTPELMSSIFRTYPSVKQKHLKYVPSKYTESEFWTKFFSSHYFHRDKANLDAKDMFADCGKQDEQELKKDLTLAIKDPLVDLTALNDCIDEEPVVTSNVKMSNLANQNMIKRFNQHSILVLKASEQTAAATNPEAVAEPAPSKRARLQDAVSYDDLESNDVDPAVHLKLSRIDRYLNGPTPTLPAMKLNGNGASSSHLDDEHYNHLVINWMNAEGYNPINVLSSSTAVTVLGQLSVGGALMRGAQVNAATHLSPQQQEELKGLYRSLSELLRHFWAAFPPSSPELIEKSNHMINVLHKFDQAKLSEYEMKLTQASTSSEAEKILRPLRFQLNAALSKYRQWSERRPVPRAAMPTL
nr:EOG090X04EN [Eubosmina coregoni]